MAGLLCSIAQANTDYLGLYMQGQRVGYSSYSQEKARFEGKLVVKSNSVTKMSANLLGTPIRLSIFSTTISDMKGSPLQMSFAMNSAGRANILIAQFKGKKVSLTSNQTGTVSHSILTMPPGEVTDDPLQGLIFGKLKRGFRKAIYVLDPTTQMFIKNVVVYRGSKAILIHHKHVDAIWVELEDPRAATEVYLSQKGNLLEADSVMGLKMVPMTKKEALAGFGNSKVDLAYGNKIVPSGNLVDPAGLRKLKLKINSSETYAKLPSDEYQSVTGSAGKFVVNIHPPYFKIPTGITIKKAHLLKPQWTKPDTDIPSNEEKFHLLAERIIGKTTDVGAAARKIQLWVYGKMTPDARIAVLRNANEVLATKRGVCRDYAILTATLLRSSGIPCKLVTGLVSWDGDFYYHAWVKFYDGTNWIGLDSTVRASQMSATHIELATGTVSDAYSAPFLQSPKITILSTSE